MLQEIATRELKKSTMRTLSSRYRSLRSGDDESEVRGVSIHIIIGDINISSPRSVNKVLTLKAPITTAADDIHKYFFIVFQRK